jgi:hypothetical protein
MPTADEPKAFLAAHWTNSICTKPNQVDNYETSNPKAVGRGVVFKRQRVSFVPDSIQAPYGADHWTTYIMGSTMDQIEALLTQLVTQFDTEANYTTNNSYSRFWIDVNNVQFLEEFEQKHSSQQWRICVTDVWGSKKVHVANRLAEPRFNPQEGGK